MPPWSSKRRRASVAVSSRWRSCWSTSGCSLKSVTLSSKESWGYHAGNVRSHSTSMALTGSASVSLNSTMATLPWSASTSRRARRRFSAQLWSRSAAAHGSLQCTCSPHAQAWQCRGRPGGKGSPQVGHGSPVRSSARPTGTSSRPASSLGVAKSSASRSSIALQKRSSETGRKRR